MARRRSCAVTVDPPPAHVAYRTFEPTPSAAPAARQFVARHCRVWGEPETTILAAVLITAELAANAIMHARSPFTLTVMASDEVVRVAVTDESASTPRRQPFDPRSSGGRGLEIVASQAERWGYEAVPGDGKVVWAEITR